MMIIQKTRFRTTTALRPPLFIHTLSMKLKLLFVYVHEARLKKLYITYACMDFVYTRCGGG